MSSTLEQALESLVGAMRSLQSGLARERHSAADHWRSMVDEVAALSADDADRAIETARRVAQSLGTGSNSLAETITPTLEGEIETVSRLAWHVESVARERSMGRLRRALTSLETAYLDASNDAGAASMRALLRRDSLDLETVRAELRSLPFRADDPGAIGRALAEVEDVIAAMSAD